MCSQEAETNTEDTLEQGFESKHVFVYSSPRVRSVFLWIPYVMNRLVAQGRRRMH